ncbi:hypothetical protein BDW22DRAFT_1461811 [Trametopsis cervina]|nr:hypothetical protein BDW22DRAFT_1461811 [Trametopsis cervina]
MSSSRLASLFSSSLRCRSGALRASRSSLVCQRTLIPAFRQNAVVRYSSRVAAQAKPADSTPKSDGETLKEIETLAAWAQQTNTDIWSQPIDTLDLIIPSWRSKRPNATIIDHIKTILQTQVNWIRNTQNMFRIASENAFPGIEIKSAWSLQIFKIRSGRWVAGLRKSALESYKNVNAAVAVNDQKVVKKYAVQGYRDTLLKRISSRDKEKHYVWRLHGENKPCAVLSIRAFFGHMGSSPPTFGNRLVIQALVKFDTNQSLEVYNKKGKRLAGDDTPKRVVEYLVLQKRGWYDGPWTIRDQLYEGLKHESVSAQ